MKREVRIEKFYPHPVEKVWRALTDRQAISEWLMQNDFELRVGHKFRFRDRPRAGWNGIVDCEVLEVVDQRRVAYSWKGSKQNDVIDTVVAWTIEPATVDGQSGTRLVLEHTGFTGLRATIVSFMLGAGWKKMLATRFPRVLARVGEDGRYTGGELPVGCH